MLAIKIYIGLQSQSLSIIGDAIHSGVDSLNNIFALWIVRISSEPADIDHPYGHDKFETLGALAVVAFLGIAAFELVDKSISRFLDPGDLPNISMMTIYLLAATLVINIFVWAYEKHMAGVLKSSLLMADAEHTWSDILISSSILASSYFIMHGYNWLDPLLGIFIAVMIARSGYEILKRTVPILVDTAWLSHDDLNDLVMSTAKVRSWSELRSRKGLEKGYVEFTVRFDTDSLSEAHKLSHDIEEKIIAKYGAAEVLVHIEP